MKDDLDNKLEDIIDKPGNLLAGETAKRVKQIKQAFIDAGWRFDPMTAVNVAVDEHGVVYAAQPRKTIAEESKVVHKYGGFRNGSSERLMSGQEFYDRFTGALKDKAVQQGDVDAAYMVNDYAARIAAGLEEQI